MITGKEALIALANGEDVETKFPHDDKWKSAGNFYIDAFLSPNSELIFRLKPRTITLNGIEIPAPFKPKSGENYYYLWDCDDGYALSSYSDLDPVIIGAWRTEDEIKQVVEALRSVFA
jgi:hypothetical protein